MKDNTKKTLKYYFKAMCGHKVSGLTLTFAAISGAVLDAVVPVLSKNFFNILYEGGIREKVVQNLLGVLLIIAIVKFIRWLLWRVASFVINFFEIFVVLSSVRYYSGFNSFYHLSIFQRSGSWSFRSSSRYYGSLFHYVQACFGADLYSAFLLI